MAVEGEGSLTPPPAPQQTAEEEKDGLNADWEEFGDALEEAEIHEKDPDKAKDMKEKGNRLYQAKDFEGAVECYTLAIELCPYVLPAIDPPRRIRRLQPDGQDDPTLPGQQKEEGTDGKGAEQQEPEEIEQEQPFSEYKEELAVYYGNRAASYVSMERDKEAVEDCTSALRLKPTYTKAALRKAQACERLDRLEDALAEYKRVLEQDPGCRVARDKVPPLEKAVAQRMEKLKEETLGKLKDLGNSLLGGFGLSLDNFNVKQDPSSGSYSISFNK